MATTAWADATNTGVQAGVALTAYNGNLVVNTPGAVISGLDIKGTVVINAPNVTLVNCKVASSSYYVVNVATGVTGVTIQNCDINGMGGGGQGIAGAGTFISNNIHGTADGIGVGGSNTVIQNNYIHDMQGTSGSHFDAIQADGGFSNLTISHNTIINEQIQTSAIMLDNYWGSISNVKIDDNLLIGGGYTVYINEIASGQPGGGKVTGVSYTNNHVGGGYFGDLNLRMELGSSIVQSGNVNDGLTLKATLNTSANTGSGSSGGSTAPGAPVIASFSTDSGTSGDKITNDNTVELKGTAAAGSTVKFYDGTTQIGSTTANSSGNWDYITKVLTDAKHTLTATATNSSGKTSAASSALAVTVDTKVAAPTIASNKVNSANQVVMSGNAEASSVVKVFDGATQIGSATANSSGVWTYTSAALAVGAHSLTAKATDVAGNISVASSVVTASVTSTSPTAPTSPTTPTSPTSPTSPTAGTVIESAGATRLVESGDKFYLNGSTGTGPTLKHGGVAFVDGSDGTWAPIAAEKTATGYQVVWKEASTGKYTAWNTDSNGNYVSHVSALKDSGSGVWGSNSGLKSLETTFHQDLNGDGQIGTSTTSTPTSPTSPTSPTADKVVESAGATRLVESGDKFYLNGSTGTGPTLKHGGVDFIDGSDGTWSPIAAEKTATGYQVVWKEASTGKYTAWNTDSNGNYVSHVSALKDSGWGVSGSNSGLKSLETSFHQDLNGDGQVATSSVAAATSQVAATSNSTSSTTKMSTSGNDVLSGTTKADTFTFAANFGNDVIKDFVARGPAHDTIEFSKSVFDSFASVLSHATQSGGDVVIAAAGDTLTLKNMKVGSLNSHDFHFA
ncbi:Ig-like domain-containing protein [Bradyrhizobium sp. CCGB12]|uniref:Ig-like domain-containing protein n=1 Tax=Bradyrhizobium sp. CCGB12 TaxID=2949632 RepID=UPI0020B17E77|nr:Ig-like domain-containing protein [Bradyrhizobium sp. CCGB12]MCP3390673.1 Ig-like domain-containing protein [Bradyrhizobium sp. CCGB12]